MDNRRRKRRRRKKNNTARIMVYVIPIAVIILAVFGITNALKKSPKTEEDRTQTESQVADSKKDLSSEDLSDDNDKSSDQTEEPSDSADNKEDETDDEKDNSDNTDDTDTAEQDKKDAFTLADLDNPEGFDERPTENGIVLENQQIDLNALDTTGLDWGQGGDLDQWNRPAGCMQYQEKYGKYNAYFISDEPEKKVIYLTIDEGYEYGCSERILNTLKEKNVHAVFFITKAYAKQNPELVQRMIDEGHEVGNHSVTHPAAGLPSQDIAQQTNEVTENHQYVKDQFGYDMHLFRYPAGKFSEQSLALLNNLNYKSIFWSFAYLDYDVENQPDPTESLQKIMDRLHPGAIYLLHAESETNTQILGDFIDQTRAQGYEFKVFE